MELVRFARSVCFLTIRWLDPCDWSARAGRLRWTIGPLSDAEYDERSQTLIDETHNE